MKTAISIPDRLFERAERMAKRTKRSRSQLFSDAIAEYLARHGPDELTEAMDQAIADVEGEGRREGSDAFVPAAARRALESSEW